MAAALPIAKIAGGGLSAYGTLRQGRAAKDAAEYNASLDEFNASQMASGKKTAISQQKRDAERTIGAARAGYSASGIDASQGSALDILQESASQAALERMNISNKYDVQEYGYRQAAKIKRYEGEQALKSSYFSAAGQLLGSAGSAAGGM